MAYSIRKHNVRLHGEHKEMTLAGHRREQKKHAKLDKWIAKQKALWKIAVPSMEDMRRAYHKRIEEENDARKAEKDRAFDERQAQALADRKAAEANEAEKRAKKRERDKRYREKKKASK